jgi:ferric-chelate reductase
VFESHPLTIANAPSSISCAASHSIVLGARATGDWTRALARHASGEQERIATENGDKVDAVRVPVHVMIDGPYGGCRLDLGDYEDVLLVAGGAGVTFTLGLLDDLVGRIVRHQRLRGERTLRVEFVWVVRSIGELSPPPPPLSYTLLNLTLSLPKDTSSGSHLCLWTLRTRQRTHRLTFTSPSS